MKLKTHARKPVNFRRYLQLLTQHLADTGLLTVFTVPPITVEEESRARFLANDIAQKLDKADGGRIRTLVAVRMYQMNVSGIVEWLKNPPAPTPKNVHDTPPTASGVSEVTE